MVRNSPITPDNSVSLQDDGVAKLTELCYKLRYKHKRPKFRKRPLIMLNLASNGGL